MPSSLDNIPTVSHSSLATTRRRATLHYKDTSCRAAITTITLRYHPFRSLLLQSFVLAYRFRRSVIPF